MTKTTRAPRVAEIAADEGYNLQGAPVLLAKLTAYVGRSIFAQLAAIAQACAGEYSKHNQAFQFTDPAARESFAAQARVILTNPAPAADPPATATQARAQSHRAARMYPTIAGMVYATSPHEANAKARDDAHAEARARVTAARAAYRAAHPDTPYTDAPTQETPPAVRVSTSRPIASTMTDRTPAGYGPAQPSLF
jgi:hypothetical protein